MIIVINSQGGLVSQQNEDLFQGSTGINTINLIAPFATNVIFKAVFEMPDGSYKPDIDGYLFEPTIQVVDGLNVWRLIVNFPITQYSGLVKMQLRGMVGNQVVCTSIIKFNVQEGLPYKNNYVEEETYDYLLGLISDLKGLLNDKVSIKKYKYQEASVNQDTAGVYYVFNVEQNKYIPKTLPTEYDENAKYFEVAIESIITNEDGLYLQFKDNINNQTMRLQVSGDKATLNDKTIVVFDDLVAKNINFDNASSGMQATNLQGAVEEIKFEVNNLETSQIVALGDRVLDQTKWIEDETGWRYEFTDQMFQNALVQDLVLTPTRKTIEDLTNSDILIYPNVEAYQQSEGVAVGVIRANKKPDIDLVFDVKVQGTTVSVSTEGIRAGQIIFGATDKIPANNVQNAIVAVQENVDNTKADLDNFKTDYAEEKQSFATLVDGKVPASQLPSFVDDVVECYIVAGSAEFSAGWLTKTQSGTALTPETNKVYLIVESGDFENKEYRWSGGRYAVIGNDLALGETSSTAYAGNKGKQNADNISQIMQDLQTIRNDVATKTKHTLLWERTDGTSTKEVTVDRSILTTRFKVYFRVYATPTPQDNYNATFDDVCCLEFIPMKEISTGALVSSYERNVVLQSSLSGTAEYVENLAYRCWLNGKGITQTEISISAGRGLSFIFSNDSVTTLMFNTRADSDYSTILAVYAIE